MNTERVRLWFVYIWSFVQVHAIQDAMQEVSGQMPMNSQQSDPIEGSRLRKPVVLVGMMGAGKTAIGRALSAELDVPFLDSDVELEAAAHMSIAEIFERDGEAFFRDRETEVIERLLQSAPAVLSTGGGAFMSERNRDLIGRFGVTVWLNADLQTLWGRVKSKDTRPLLRTDNPYQTLSDIYAARAPIYQLADVHVKAESHFSITDTMTAVVAALAARTDVLEPHND